LIALKRLGIKTNSNGKLMQEDENIFPDRLFAIALFFK
jgi:hypothetical protein